MKKQLIYLGSITALTVSLMTIAPREVKAFEGTRYDPCVCYTYFTDGHVEIGQSCEHPNANGACPNSVSCLPENEEDRLQ